MESMECTVCYEPLLNDPTDVSSTGPPGQRPRPNARRRNASGPGGVVCTPCGHLLHRACIARWFRQGTTGLRGRPPTTTGAASARGTCPQCRARVKESSLYPVFLQSVADRPTSTVAVAVSSSPGKKEEAGTQTITNTGTGQPAPEVADEEEEFFSDDEYDEDGECEKTNCQDLKLMLKLAQKDIADLQAKLEDWKSKFEDLAYQKARIETELTQK